MTDIVYKTQELPLRANRNVSIPQHHSNLLLTIETTEKRVASVLETQTSVKVVRRKITAEEEELANQPAVAGISPAEKQIIHGFQRPAPKKRGYLTINEKVTRTIQPMPEFIKANEFGRWPKRTDIKCHWCTLHFDTVPVIMPRWIDRTGKIYGHGVYSGFACMLADIPHQISPERRGEIYGLAFYMMTHVFGEKANDVFFEAPDKNVMIEYGGEMPAEEYKKIIAEANVTVVYSLPPIQALIPRMIRVGYSFMTPTTIKQNVSRSTINNLGQLVEI